MGPGGCHWEARGMGTKEAVTSRQAIKQTSSQVDLSGVGGNRQAFKWRNGAVFFLKALLCLPTDGNHACVEDPRLADRVALASKKQSLTTKKKKTTSE